MKTIVIARHGGPEVLEVREAAVSKLAPGDVRVRVRASGVNFADLMMRMGLYPEAPPPPFVPGYEFAGTVVEVYGEVGELRVGERVVGATEFGAYTDESVVPAWQLRRVPSGISDVEAAAIPVNYLTAWMALHEMARVRQGDRVLVWSAAGGVGTAAVQIAARAGAHVVGMVGSESKFQAVRDLGAREVWKNGDWKRPDFDIILDPVGGARLKESFRHLGAAGRVITFGASDMVGGRRRSLLKTLRFMLRTPIYTPFQLMMKNRGVFGLNMLPLIREPELLKRCFDSVLGCFERGEFRVVIGKTFPLEQAGAAQEYLASRQNIGKVILTS